MSFLAKYWNAVERAVSETGMNPGDIIVDITKVIKNTEVLDDVELHVSDVPNHKPDTPAKAGHMPRHTSDIAAMEVKARRVARPGELFDQMEESFIPRKGDKRQVRDRMDPECRDRPINTGKTSKTLRKEKRKQLKKLGGGRRVRVIIDEVRIDDTVVWPKPTTDH